MLRLFTNHFWFFVHEQLEEHKYMLYFKGWMNELKVMLRTWVGLAPVAYTDWSRR